MRKFFVSFKNLEGVCCYFIFMLLRLVIVFECSLNFGIKGLYLYFFKIKVFYKYFGLKILKKFF